MNPGPLDYITLVTAILGAITGIAALIWQAVTFILSGSRVKVTLKVGWIGNGDAVVGMPGSWDWGQPPNTSFDTECLCVEIRNEGRSPASITAWNLQVGPTFLTYPQDSVNKAIPLQLEGGASNTWFGQMHHVIATAKALRHGPSKTEGHVVPREILLNLTPHYMICRTHSLG